jgi:hypothetical protein
MSATTGDSKRRTALMRFGIAVVVLLAAGLLHQAMGAHLLLPKLDSSDPRDVILAYYTARQWGLAGIAERALSAEVAQPLPPWGLRPSIGDDAFMATRLSVSPTGDGVADPGWDEVRHYDVGYLSQWRNVIGEHKRYGTVRIGRDAGEPWRILTRDPQNPI